MAVFIDTNIFIAYANARDEQHEKALQIMGRIMAFEYGLPVTSDYVFDEAVTVAFARTNDKTVSVKLGNQIMSSIRVLKINEFVFGKAWRIFKSSSSKLSFTDCTNIAFLEVVKDNKIATFDAEFEKVDGIKVIC